MTAHETKDILKRLFDLECDLLERLDGENLEIFNEYIDAVCEYRDALGVIGE